MTVKTENTREWCSACCSARESDRIACLPRRRSFGSSRNLYSPIFPRLHNEPKERLRGRLTPPESDDLLRITPSLRPSGQDSWIRRKSKLASLQERTSEFIYMATWNNYCAELCYRFILLYFYLFLCVFLLL